MAEPQRHLCRLEESAATEQEDGLAAPDGRCFVGVDGGHWAWLLFGARFLAGLLRLLGVGLALALISCGFRATRRGFHPIRCAGGARCCTGRDSGGPPGISGAVPSGNPPG
eukprot:GHVU01156251.1.p4 GENE.GHVU01156251.1~~GHVU01156251.1.p4  ORF type:complete len:111 (+),score=1.33 GHVU01156251.1:1424-1756(+)